MRFWLRDKLERFSNWRTVRRERRIERRIRRFDATSVYTVKEMNGGMIYWLTCLFLLSGIVSLLVPSPFGLFVHWHFTMPLIGTTFLSVCLNAYLINLRGKLNGEPFWTHDKARWCGDFLQTVCKWTWIFFLFQMALVGLSLTGDAIFLDITWVIALKELFFANFWAVNQTLMLLTSFGSLGFTKFKFFLRNREWQREVDREELELVRHLERKKREGWIAYQKRRNHLPDELFII